jgi:hypothetical protein
LLGLANIDFKITGALVDANTEELKKQRGQYIMSDREEE